jgi:hypothetical protein
VKLVRTTSRCWPTEAFGSAIGKGGTIRAEVLSSGAASSFEPLSPPPPQLEQPEQLDEQPQEGSQQQLASQQPQPCPRNIPQRPSSRQQPLWQPQLEQQLLSQPHEASLQPHEASSQQPESQPQLASQQPQPLWPHKLLINRLRQQPPPQPQLEQQLSSQPQDASSQQHDFSQQLQLASEQHPQPPPSIRSSKQQAPKLGLARAMLIMSAPNKFHFIEHRLLFVEFPLAESVPTSGNARCRPTPD